MIEIISIDLLKASDVNFTFFVNDMHILLPRVQVKYKWDVVEANSRHSPRPADHLQLRFGRVAVLDIF